MLRFSVELDHYGLGDIKDTLVQGVIINTGEHPRRPEFGEYKIRIHAPFKTEFYITNHNRKDGYQELMIQVFQKLKTIPKFEESE